MSATDLDEESFSGPHPYFVALETFFIDLRGAPLQLASVDWQVAREWYEQGIPIELVRQALREAWERRGERARKKILTLRYFRRAVLTAWRRAQELQAPAASGTAETLDVAARLVRLAAALPAELPEGPRWAQRLAGLGGDAEEVEAQLAVLDGEILAAAESALSAAVRRELEGELEAAVAALARRLPADELARARGRLWEEVVRRRWSLPMLSLFAPEAAAAED